MWTATVRNTASQSLHSWCGDFCRRRRPLRRGGKGQGQYAKILCKNNILPINGRRRFQLLAIFFHFSGENRQKSRLASRLFARAALVLIFKNINILDIAISLFDQRWRRNVKKSGKVILIARRYERKSLILLLNCNEIFNLVNISRGYERPPVADCQVDFSSLARRLLKRSQHLIFTCRFHDGFSVPASAGRFRPRRQSGFFVRTLIRRRPMAGLNY